MPTHPHPRPLIQQPNDPSIRHIPLTQGKVAIVDAEDYEWLSQWLWYARKDNLTFYAARKTLGPNRVEIRMHSEIGERFGVPSPDHKNGDGLDNRRLNLRKADRFQQNANRVRHSNNLVGMKGVRKTEEGTYHVRITFHKKLISVGTFKEREAAGRAYDAKAIELFGEFANLNFPPNKEASRELVSI